MKYTRTPTTTAAPVSVREVKEFLRFDSDEEEYLTDGLIRTAASDIEAQADIALLPQTITATTAEAPEQSMSLPVGPVSDGATVTVATLAADGTVTALPSGWWLEAGRYPVLHFTATPPADRVRVTYQAGFAVLPDDLRMAIIDQTARLWDFRNAWRKPGVVIHSFRAATGVDHETRHQGHAVSADAAHSRGTECRRPLEAGTLSAAICEGRP